MKKKYFIILVDILTIILIILYAQAISLMIIESYQYYNFPSFFEYILFYYLYGIIRLISESGYGNIFVCLSILIYILNIYIIYNKYRNLSKRKILLMVIISIQLYLIYYLLCLKLYNIVLL